MDENDIEARKAEKLALLDKAARDSFSLATVQNIASNGRLFCALIFAAHITAYLKTGSVLFALLAIVAAVPVGASCLIDQMAVGNLRSFLSSAAYAVAASAAFAFIFAIVLGA